MHVLLVEDDDLLGDGVRSGLEVNGCDVNWVRDGIAAERAISHVAFDVIVLDLGLPRKPGAKVLADMRARGDRTPVLILTALDGLEDRVSGLDAGADDYMTKPFELDELAARLRALARRTASPAVTTLRSGNLTLEPDSREVVVDGAAVALSRREFTILRALMSNTGHTLSTEMLQEKLYGLGEETESNAVVVHIHNLRRKLGPGHIRTVRGAGYYMTDEQK